jgi:hypothetical protein
MNLDKFIKKYAGITESYWFFDNTIELKYDVKKHLYLLVKEDGFEELPSVSTICHIIDKSQILIPWGCKVMEQKLLTTLPKLGQSGRYEFTEEQLLKWIKEGKKAHKEHLQTAGDIGTEAHAWIERSINNLISNPDTCTAEALPENEKSASAVIASLDFISAHNIRWISTELKICSMAYKYAGTCDGICIADSCNDQKCCPEPFKDKLSVIDWKTSNQLSVEFKLQVAAYKKAYEEETGKVIDNAWIIRLGKTNGKFETWHLNGSDLDEAWESFKAALTLYKTYKILKEKS